MRKHGCPTFAANSKRTGRASLACTDTTVLIRQTHMITKRELHRTNILCFIVFYFDLFRYSNGRLYHPLTIYPTGYSIYACQTTPPSSPSSTAFVVRLMAFPRCVRTKGIVSRSCARSLRHGRHSRAPHGIFSQEVRRCADEKCYAELEDVVKELLR